MTNGVGIAPAQNKKVLKVRNGITKDIVSEVLSGVVGVKDQTRQFSKQFTANRDGMQKLWRWVRTNIHYKEDPAGIQWVKEPARLYADRQGDCKSFTIFIVSVLQNLGVEHLIRFTNTERPNSRIVNHVYPVAIIDNEEIIVDAVYHLFDEEHSYYYKKDFEMADIYRLSGIRGVRGIGAAQAAELDRYSAELDAIADSIPDSVLQDDITSMSKGEFLRYQQAQVFLAQAEHAPNTEGAMRYQAAADAVRSGNLAGIGSLNSNERQAITSFLQSTANQTAPAFVAPAVEIPDGILGVGNVATDILDKIKGAWRKVVNWMFKKALPAASPFFLYLFIQKKVWSKVINRKKDKQAKIFNFIKSSGKFESDENLENAIRAGIIKKMGKQPEQILAEKSGGKVSGAGIGVVTAILAAIPLVLEIIQKLAGLFKKKGPDVSGEDAPDLEELQYEAPPPGEENALKPNPNPPALKKDDNNQMLMFGGLALLGVIMYTQRH